MPLFSVTVREHAYTGIFYSDVVEAGSARDAVTVAGARAEARPWFPEDAAPAPVPPRGFSVVVRGQAGAGPLYSDTVQAGSAAEALRVVAALAAAPQPAGPGTWAGAEGGPRCLDVWIYSLLHCECPAGHEPPHQATARGYGRVARWVRDARGIAHAVPQPPARA
jgi:hypothetical protein